MRRLAGTGCVVALTCLTVGGVALAVTEHGGKGRDRLLGTKGDDTLRGLRGRDVLIGGRGRDVLIGGRGADVLRGGRGRDGFNMRDRVQLAAPGRDRIHARDGRQDEINCGAGGNDLAIVDASEDGVYDCELVREP
jgi:Ca2+-binding RTX toxin-like protein